MYLYVLIYIHMYLCVYVYLFIYYVTPRHKMKNIIVIGIVDAMAVGFVITGSTPTAVSAQGNMTAGGGDIVQAQIVGLQVQSFSLFMNIKGPNWAAIWIQYSPVRTYCQNCNDNENLNASKKLRIPRCCHFQSL
jgi:hypothetical protein